MIVPYTSQEIKSSRTQAIVTGKLLYSCFLVASMIEGSLHCPLTYYTVACIGAWL